MKPQWFAIPPDYLNCDADADGPEHWTKGEEQLQDIPLTQMWPDDKFWMPLLLKGTYFIGRADFGIADSDAQKGSWVMERWWFGTKAEAGLGRSQP